MKVNKSSLFFLVPFALLLLCRCDTSHNIDSPVKSYFLKYIGNEGDQTGLDFEINPDGTFVLLGTTRKKATGNTQLYVVKADPQGNVLWERTLGQSLDMEARDIELASDGRIVILGNSYASGSIASGGSRDILLMTLTPDGATIDSVLHGFKHAITNADTDEDASSVTQTNDGFIVAGSSDNLVHSSDNSFKRDGLIWRVNDNLTPYSTSWAVRPAYGQGTENVTTKIIQLANNDFYAFGYAKWSTNNSSQNDFDFWYFSVGNAGGDPTNSGSFGSPGTDEKLKSVIYIPPQFGEGFFLGGVVTDQSGNDDAYFTRLRSELNFNATDPFDGFSPQPLGYNLGQLKNEWVSVALSQPSSYFVLVNEAKTGSSNLFLMKIGPDGKRAWPPVIYGGQGDDFIGSVHELPDGKIAVFGTMAIGQNGETKMVLIKVNKDGQFSD